MQNQEAFSRGFSVSSHNPLTRVFSESNGLKVRAFLSACAPEAGLVGTLAGAWMLRDAILTNLIPSMLAFIALCYVFGFWFKSAHVEASEDRRIASLTRY